MKQKLALLICIVVTCSVNGASLPFTIFNPEHYGVTGPAFDGNKEDERLIKLKHELDDNLRNNILSYWSAKMVDRENGGFYGRISGTDKVFPAEDKGGILNARILWTYSAAYRVTRDTAYLRLATRSKDYIMKHFIDKEYGGAYRSVKATGEPSDTRKQTYTQSFFIYGLSEYARATGDKEALKAAKDIFECFEKYVLDKEANGYFEAFTRDWTRSRDRLIGESSDRDEKTMNTSLHLMEAYANLYRVWPDKRMAERLRNMVEIFLTKIVDNKRYHLICFMDRNWNPTSTNDSYGHDIEASWLIYEAASLLKDPALTARAKDVCVKMAAAVMEGVQPDGSIIDDRNYVTGHLRTSRSWWSQAEAVVGFLNAYELSGDKKYIAYSLNAWEYIKKYLVDYTNGGWFTSVNNEGVVSKGDKGGFWVCPYHNGRMCMEVIERVN
ncbi:MAG: AGE family epimerase/isomerase [Bacteroidales bacterium]|jgi:mannobiose 2-epimerase|nr:AGE family epimerase/isomerase [Bacteroidales bacterium]